MKRIISSRILISAVLVLSAFVGTRVGLVNAQSNASWTQCTDGKAIVRCETYDCPNGDTNKDGKCTLSDDNARLTDARNDSFCANPLSGCGQVQYYPANSSSECSVRVEEKDNGSCDLYAVANPDFTPQPSVNSATDSNTSKCVDLKASSTKGSAPLKVTFTGDATDSNGAIKEYHFKFTNSEGTVGEVEQKTNVITQTFNDPGTYTARLTVLDSKNKLVTSNACEVQIQVTNSTTKGGLTTDDKLPETGGELWVGFGLVGLAIAGAYLHEHYRVI